MSVDWKNSGFKTVLSTSRQAITASDRISPGFLIILNLMSQKSLDNLAVSNECECPDPGNSFEKLSPIHTEGTYDSICSWSPLCNQQRVTGLEWVMLFKYRMCFGVAVFLNDHI